MKKVENSLLEIAKTGGWNEVDDEGKEEGSGNTGKEVSESLEEGEGQDA